jgi:hypothetical protein
MPYYRVRLHGRNIVRDIDGRRELQNFITTRVIEAATGEHAAEQALELIYNIPELKEPLNGPDDPFPVVLVEAVEAIDTFDLS